MNCRRINSILSAYIDGELSGSEHQLVHEHLKTCENCNQEYEELLLTKRLLSGLKVKDPVEGLDQQIISRLREEETKGSRRYPLFAWWSFLIPTWLRKTAFGAVCLAGCLFAFFLVHTAVKSQQPTELASKMPTNPVIIQQKPSEVNDYVWLHDSSGRPRMSNSGTPVVPASQNYTIEDDH